jgi:predicted DNA repair protein MutK
MKDHESAMTCFWLSFGGTLLVGWLCLIALWPLLSVGAVLLCVWGYHRLRSMAVEDAREDSREASREYWDFVNGEYKPETFSEFWK